MISIDPPHTNMFGRTSLKLHPKFRHISGCLWSA